MYAIVMRADMVNSDVMYLKQNDHWGGSGFLSRQIPIT